ncbi:ABC transporter substrate-binding protein [Nonomuraea sp. NPDC050556]|uniref:ABC transporter substrate-binding protein n=1 Tax=Nonomuraea sp. NPDC050556 TaxID=3364369 RepID=UPI0037A38285
MWIRRTAVALAVVIAAAGCGSGGSGGDTLKIGFFSPITGATSADGVSAKNGALLAVEDINKKGGKKVELVAYDDQGKPEQAVTIARKLIQEDQVAGIVSGAYSPPTTAAAPIVQQAKIPMLSAYAVSPKITQAGEYIYRAGPAGAVEGAAAAVFTKTKLPGPPKKVAVITGDLDPLIVISEAFKARATKEGLEVFDGGKFALADTDFRPLLGRIKAAAPEAVYAAGYYDNAALLLTQAKEIGLTAPFVFGSTSDSYKVFELAKDNAAEGAYLTTDFDRGDRPVVSSFISAYKAKYNVEPDIVAAASYDAVTAMALAAAKGGDLNKAIAGLTNVDLVTGPVDKVSAARDFERPLSLQVGKGGKWTHFASLPWADVVGD